MQTILVIDDEVPTLTMFRLFLSAYGYRVLTAEDGLAGLQILEKENPPIVFTDLKMPVMDGFDVIKAIKKRAPKTEVVVITGHGDMDLVLQALNLEATDFINKPIDRAALDSALRRANLRLQDEHADREQLTLDRGTAKAVITVKGKLLGTPRSRLKALAREAIAGQPAEVVIHLDPNLAVTGTGITALTQVLDEFRQAGLNVAFTGLSMNLKTVFEMLGVTRYVKIYETGEEAIASGPP
ncbi:MAG: response regulator [Desulfobacterales bacterium]|jgi:DNA-binding NtrC family response regulator